MLNSNEIPSTFQPLLPMEVHLIESLNKEETCQSNSEANTIRAELIRHLCLDPKTYENCPSKEISINGAFIEGDLNLINVEIKLLLTFRNCNFEGQINLAGAKLPSLDLTGSRIKGLYASRVEIKQSLILCQSDDAQQRPFSATNVFLGGAIIHGNLNCDGGQFYGGHEETFFAEHISVGNNFLLRRATINGTLHIMFATIKGNLECDGMQITNPEKITIFAENITVSGNVYLRKIEITDKSSEKKPWPFISEGEVVFTGARIAGNLECQAASLSNASRRAFSGDKMQVDGVVLFREFLIAKGEVRFYAAQMDELDCTNGVFDNPSGDCFVGSYMNVKRAFKWFDVSCEGRVILYKAKVTHLVDTYSSWPQKPGLLELDDFEYEMIETEPEIGFSRLKWLELQIPRDGIKAKFQRIIDRTYNRFQNDPSQKRKIVLPHIPGIQPYEQLILVLNKMGWYTEAKKIQIAKNRYVTKYLTHGVKFGRWIQSLVDYGYSPIKALVPMIIMVILGAWCFQQAYDNQTITPTSSPVSVESTFYPYPEFNSILYSIDVFLPIVDLHQEEYWIPNSGYPYGEYYYYYMVFHIAAGWFLTTLFVAAISGLVRTD